MKGALQALQEKVDEAEERAQFYENNTDIACFMKVLNGAAQGDKTAEFVRNQVRSFSTKKPHYSDVILRECVIWKACFNKSYEHARSRNIFQLPCRSTLQKYVGHLTGGIGVTSLIKERLCIEFKGLTVEQEAFCSLIVDEMAIQQRVIYDRQVDKLFGFVDRGEEEHSTAVPQVANRLLCFVIRGLSTSYIIPVGYFFTRCLKGDQLFSMTMEVLKVDLRGGRPRHGSLQSFHQKALTNASCQLGRKC